MENEVSKTIKEGGVDRVSDQVKDYGNDPFFIKKGRQSQEFLKKNGFPKELLEKRRK